MEPFLKEPPKRQANRDESRGFTPNPGEAVRRQTVTGIRIRKFFLDKPPGIRYHENKNLKGKKMSTRLTDEERIKKQLDQKAKRLGQLTTPTKKSIKSKKTTTAEEAIENLDNGS